MNDVSKRKITQFIFIDNNFKQKRNKYDKNAHKMSVVYFKGGAVYFHLSSLIQCKTAAVNLISTVQCCNQGTMTKVKTAWYGCVVTVTVTIV